jgi:predicted Zn-dependent protease
MKNLRLISSLLAATVLLLAAWMALRMGAASWTAEDLEQSLTFWDKRTNDTGLPPTQAEWQTSMNALQAAIARNPRDPHLQELESRLLALTIRTGDGVTNRQPESIAPLERAAALRPTSPYTWANLAWALYANGRVDTRFYATLERVVDTGPFEREALFVVIDLGLAVWDTAPKSTQLAIQTALKNADRREAPTIAAIAGRRGKLEQACALANTGKQPACAREKPTT